MEVMAGETSLHVWDIHIEDDYQRKGLGKHLLTLMELIARRYHIYLYVHMNIHILNIHTLHMHTFINTCICISVLTLMELIARRHHIFMDLFICTRTYVTYTYIHKYMYICILLYS
jgi:GNAT superfamily N-acetyltransferase